MKSEAAAFLDKARECLAKADGMLGRWPDEAGCEAYLAGLHAAQGYCHINFDRAAFGREWQRPMIYAAWRTCVSCRHTSKASDLIDR